MNEAAKKIAQLVWDMHSLDPEETLGDDHDDQEQFEQKVLKILNTESDVDRNRPGR